MCWLIYPWSSVLVVCKKLVFGRNFVHRLLFNEKLEENIMFGTGFFFFFLKKSIFSVLVVKTQNGGEHYVGRHLWTRSVLIVQKIVFSL